MTASPEWWKSATTEQQEKFFNRCVAWLGDKYGRENILVATIHRDETSPHLSAFVVPLTADKRLSAKEFIGNKTKMSEDQTTFADKMKDLGLQRGIKGSKAKHQTIREYYAHANATELLKTQQIALPEAKLLEGKESYGMRCSQNVLDILNPQLQRATAKATSAAKQIDAANREKAAAEAKAIEARNAEILARREVTELKKWQEQARVRVRDGGEALQRWHDLLNGKGKQQETEKDPTRTISR
jgi:hypothetical protein